MFVYAHYQVHDLDPTTWKTVEVVHIDIADRSQVEHAVSSLSISLETLCIVCMFFVLFGNITHFEYNANSPSLLVILWSDGTQK